MQPDQLLAYIFQAQTHELATQFAHWIVLSSRFATFAEQYRDKIRKKVRGIRDSEGLHDLTFELVIAYVILAEQRFTLEYEPDGVGKQRGPDFRVMFRTRIPFTIEVKRLRTPTNHHSDEAAEYSRVASATCAKLGQLTAGMINLVAISLDNVYAMEDIAAAQAALRMRAEHKDHDFFTRRGFNSADDFLKQYQRLSALLLFPPRSSDMLGHLWINNLARYRLPNDLQNVLQRLLSAPQANQ